MLREKERRGFHTPKIPAPPRGETGAANPHLKEGACAYGIGHELSVIGLEDSMNRMSNPDSDLHFTNLGASVKPPCADEEGFIRFRKDFQELPESEWTEGERWIDGMEKQIQEFRNR